jgi:Zn-dependent protease with chaperone function
MFYLLCSCLVFAVMFTALSLATLACAPVLRLLTGLKHLVRAGTTSNLLFMFRALPFVLGVVASLGLALPAFLEFEPYSTSEMPGPALLLLAGLGLVIALTMVWRCLRILAVTLSLQRRWLKSSSQLMITFNGIPVFCVHDSASLLAVTGIFSRRIFVSRDVADILNAAELNAALSHELAHVSTNDNLRKLVLKVMCPPPFWPFLSDVDSFWARASELAADERAIAHGTSPLDLSSALIKVGRLSFHRRPALLAASHLVDGCSSATVARAERLRQWIEGGTVCPQPSSVEHRLRPWFACAAIVLLYLLALRTILPPIHDFLEFIVR